MTRRPSKAHAQKEIAVKENESGGPVCAVCGGSVAQAVAPYETPNRDQDHFKVTVFAYAEVNPALAQLQLHVCAKCARRTEGAEQVGRTIAAHLFLLTSGARIGPRGGP